MDQLQHTSLYKLFKFVASNTRTQYELIAYKDKEFAICTKMVIKNKLDKEDKSQNEPVTYDLTLQLFRVFDSKNAITGVTRMKAAVKKVMAGAKARIVPDKEGSQLTQNSCNLIKVKGLDEIVVEKDCILNKHDTYLSKNMFKRECENMALLSYKLSAQNIFYFTVEK